MNNEINLILTKLKIVSEEKENGMYLCDKKHSKVLLDYITNLQEENERLTRFKYNIPNDKTTSVPTITKSYKKEYENYKSRCEKAIEYIKKNYFEIVYKTKGTMENDLLKLLGGD